MVCLKCGKFNMSQNKECAFCGEPLFKNSGAVSFKEFLGEKSVSPENENSLGENVVKFESLSIEDKDDQEEVFEINLSDDINETYEVLVCAEEEITSNERTRLRNIAVLAVGSGVIVSALLLVVFIVIFRFVAVKII